MNTQQWRIGGIAILSALTLLVSLGVTPSFATVSTAKCQVANLSLTIGERISPKTQEAGDAYILTNRGKTVCQLRGYPRVSFYDNKGRVLPFKYVVGGGKSAEYVTQSGPKTVVLPPRGHAFFLVAKSTCTVGDAMLAKTIRVYPPNSRHQLVGPAFLPVGASTIAYCKGGTRDHGQGVEVSPVTATRSATFTTIMR
jgi:hypothetical protein